jgi:hypothetical protein
VPENIEEREAQWGKRMIEIQVRFWTDGIAEAKGHIQPKHCWDAGVIKIQRNDAHGVTPSNPIPFNGLIDMSRKIEQVLIIHGIKVRLSPRQRRYLVG